MNILIQTKRGRARRKSAWQAKEAEREANEAEWDARYNEMWDEYREMRDVPGPLADSSESWLYGNVLFLNPHIYGDYAGLDVDYFDLGAALAKFKASWLAKWRWRL